MIVSTPEIPTMSDRGLRSPLIRLQPDSHLVTRLRAGDDRAFDVIVDRYQTRLLSFCRHMLGSHEDAEDVLQETFSAAYHAIRADDRPINLRPWLYKIARNRCLNHLRRTPAIGLDSMDDLFYGHGESTADLVHRREDFRLLLNDIQALPESQRTALILREMDALSYDQIAEAMETTVSSVKSLLVRARISLAEAGEARLLSCDDVRAHLAETAEGLRRRVAAPVKRHIKACACCQGFEHQLRQTERVLTALFPLAGVGPGLWGLFARHGTRTRQTNWRPAHAVGPAGSGSGVSAAAGASATSAAPTGLLGAGMAGISVKAAAGITVALIAAGATIGAESSRSPSEPSLARPSRTLTATRGRTGPSAEPGRLTAGRRSRGPLDLTSGVRSSARTASSSSRSEATQGGDRAGTLTPTSTLAGQFGALVTHGSSTKSGPSSLPRVHTSAGPGSVELGPEGSSAATVGAVNHAGSAAASATGTMLSGVAPTSLKGSTAPSVPVPPSVQVSGSTLTSAILGQTTAASQTSGTHPAATSTSLTDPRF